MEIVHLSKENLYEYEDFLGADIAENIGREFYRGMVACEGGEPEAGLIWELTGLYDDMSQTQSRIEWYHAEDAESLEFLLDTYTYTISKDGVEKSFFEFEEPPEENEEIEDEIDDTNKIIKKTKETKTKISKKEKPKLSDNEKYLFQTLIEQL